MYRFGLIGRNISYSFSRGYFSKKFEEENLPFTYENFDIPNISKVAEIFKTPGLKGLNVTIPYKESVIPFLDDIDATAKEIGAVNTIKIFPNGRTKGFNTDHIGFLESLIPFLPIESASALVLGTGGASKAILFALKSLGFHSTVVSRTKSPSVLSYSELNDEIIRNHSLIVNCTPLGTFPNIADYPPIPYESANESHLFYDLIYNPAETTFLRKGREKGAKICNGLPMLIGQAEKAWEIWQSD